VRVSAQAPRFFVIYDSQFPLASSRFGRDSIQYRAGKTHCQGHQDPSKRAPIFPGTQEANVKMVPIGSVPISRLRTGGPGSRGGDSVTRTGTCACASHARRSSAFARCAVAMCRVPSNSTSVRRCNEIVCFIIIICICIRRCNLWPFGACC